MNPNPFTRRDFLKLFSLLPFSILPSRMRYAPATKDEPGVIILVCDALSATNLSLYGYPRNTSPNLEKFAERATVYHAHYAGGSFTVTGAASLLTGTYPWTHRAFLQNSRIAMDRVDTNIFNLCGDACFRVGYSQNPWADLFLYQFSKSLDLHVNGDSFNAVDTASYNGIFKNDPILSFRGVENYAFTVDESPYNSAPFFGLWRKIWIWLAQQGLYENRKDQYPLGIPEVTCDTKNVFLLEDLFQGIESLVESFSRRSLAYIHIFPPHHPYAPRAENLARFKNDGWKPLRKAPHFFSQQKDDEFLEARRCEYDAYVSTLDEELGSFFDFLAERGILDNNYVIVTSDHGEMMERGEFGHVTPMLFEPLVHVPLLVSAPGQTKRVDVAEPTSCVDILPTILSIFGKPAPNILEGRILPGFGGENVADVRPIYFVDAKEISVHAPLTEASVGMRKGRYKLLRYYSRRNALPKNYELYDMQNDPEELHDLGETEKELAASLVAELDGKMEEVNQPYFQKG